MPTAGSASLQPGWCACTGATWCRARSACGDAELRLGLGRRRVEQVRGQRPRAVGGERVEQQALVGVGDRVPRVALGALQRAAAVALDDLRLVEEPLEL